MQRKTLLGVAFAAALMGVGVAAQAQIAITVAPPAPRYEVVPAAREGYVWAPGHWEWRHGEYVWDAGRWMPERRGYEYHESRWVQRGNGEWVLVGGNWEHRMEQREARRERRWEEHHHARGRDFDGDGVPDRFDRFPRNPNRS